MAFELPKLPYAHNALAPYIDANTMQIHHEKHHQAYVNKLNEAMKADNIPEQSLETLMKKMSQYKTAVRNNGGGHYNHSLFWAMLSPNGGGLPVGELAQAINQHFGSLDQFKAKFSTAATTRFGSGWAWLCVDAAGALCICSTPNQDNPLMDVAECQGTPIVGLDVWEHAYYLKYQNRRPDYIAAFWQVINWQAVAERFQQAQ